MNPADTLRAAAARVRQGWCQHTVEQNGKVCALGAIYRTSFVHYDEASQSLRDTLHVVYGGVADWNDRHDQTAENVARTMERAADQWEAEHEAPQVKWAHRSDRELVS